MPDGFFPNLSPQAVANIAGEAHRRGHCLDCGICGKPFTAARRPKSTGSVVDPVRYPGVTVVFLLCRKCTGLPDEDKRRAARLEAAGTMQRFYLAHTRPAGRA